jgi:hypothetical protein
MVRSLEVIRVFAGPSPLAGRFTGLAAVRLAAVDLRLDVTVIGEEEVFATRTLPFSDAFHDPEPPGQSSNMNGSKGRKREKQGRKPKNGFNNRLVKKTRPKPKKMHFHNAEEDAFSGRR